MQRCVYRIQFFPISDCGFAFVVKIPGRRESDVVMKTPTRKLSVQSAFSLVELLVVIAVIAVIAAIAIPNIANITGSASEATKLRNAQQLVSTYNNYAEAYYAASNVYPNATPTVALALTAIGGSNSAAVVNTRLGVTNTFSLPGLTAANVATNKISSVGSQLSYNPDL